MPPSSPSTSLYSLGRGILYIGEWTGSTPPTEPAGLFDVGNCPKFEVEISEEKLDHMSSRSGIRVKDKSITLEIGYTVSFDLDEMSTRNMLMWMRGTQSGSALRAATAMDKEYALKFVSDNPAGPNETWKFHRVKLTPGGAFGLISDEWQLLSFTGEGLADIAHQAASPYFTVTFATTTTTTTSS